MKNMNRVILIVLDGVGAGAQNDAARYKDTGADTLGHVIAQKHPFIPNLTELGLLSSIRMQPLGGDNPIGCYGTMIEKAAGKDTTTGHWELAGLTLKNNFPVFPNGFPPAVIQKVEEATGHSFIGNKAASGTEIIKELGDEHLRTGKLIVYTSADSVFQIAAHEAIIPPMELWHICRIARRTLTGPNAVGRVIARPFAGSSGEFYRTENRRDFSVDPTGETMLDVIRSSGKDVMAVGKIDDIFNHKGITKSNHASGNEACCDAILDYLHNPRWSGLLFANLVDTDMLYGHRRDLDGFAQSLEAFDLRLPSILCAMKENDMLIITADHGCDPTFTAHTDHTREMVPVVCWGLGLSENIDIGRRSTFADVSATILEALGCEKKLDGKSFYKDILYQPEDPE